MTIESEWLLVETTAIAEPLFYAVAVLAFLAGSVLLVWKTRVPGRLLILSSVLVLVAPLPLLWSSASIPISPSVAPIAVGRLSIALAAMLCALGYGRMVVHLYRSNHDKAS